MGDWLMGDWLMGDWLMGGSMLMCHAHFSDYAICRCQQNISTHPVEWC